MKASALKPSYFTEMKNNQQTLRNIYTPNLGRYRQV